MTEAYIDVFLIAKLYVVHDRLMRCSSSKDGHLLLSLVFHLKATYGSQQPAGASKTASSLNPGTAIARWSRQPI
ncbi:hypothetical protein HFO99_17090 [Rhizobium leguminosarum]|uniref:hypothetical protein n=1 Tax=Rhizobium leguminosarum TaxID=384 RepID=UPI001C97EE8B|nr:hypothetical protein [Rhizobium leguminosarum]MBY5335626.1 hypothetical protein [Rhizobium leguminosarum]